MSPCACKPTARDAVFSVIDDGVGLPETDRDRLTEPYVTHKPKGTGLGLAIVRKIMEDHEGRLELFEGPDRRRRRGTPGPARSACGV